MSMVLKVADFIKSGRKLQLNKAIATGTPLCIVDASFNPPHWAHVKLARLCAQLFPGATLVLMLATGNADKPSAPESDLQARLEMMDIVANTELKTWPVALALCSEAMFLAKAQVFRSQFPASRVIFSMGFDTLLRLCDPKYYSGTTVDTVLRNLFDVAELLVLTREEDEVSHTPQMGPAVTQSQQLAEKFIPYQDRIHFQLSTEDTNEVSSSRARRSEGELRRVTPSAVAEYVLQNRLYGLNPKV